MIRAAELFCEYKKCTHTFCIKECAVLDQVLEGLNLTADQFVDLCILCGCDYCGTIKGVFASCSLFPQSLDILTMVPAMHLETLADS